MNLQKSRELGVTCKLSEMITVDIYYYGADPISCKIKANNMLCWLIENKIRHELIFDSWAEEIPIAAGFENSEDAVAFKLKWKV